MLTIALFAAIIFIITYFFKLHKKTPEDACEVMADNCGEPEQVRCSSSESDNFEKIDNEESRLDENGEPLNFVVGDETPSPAEDEEDDGPSHEGRDSFPNAPPPNIRRMLTPAQQLALAEKRATLR